MSGNTYCHSDLYKCPDGLKMSQFNQILEDVQEYYGDKWIIEPNLQEDAGGGIDYQIPDYYNKIKNGEIIINDHKNPYRHICWKLNNHNYGGEIRGKFPEFPNTDVNIPDDEFIIYPSNFKFGFVLKSFYNNDPFTRTELDDLNIIFNKYGLNTINTGKGLKKNLND